MEFKKLFNLWDTLELYLTGILVALATGFSFYQVVMRYVLNKAPEWAEESIMYLIIWSIFIISSKLIRDDAHVGATFFIDSMPAKVKRIVHIAINLFTISFCALVIVYGFQIVGFAYSMDERSTTKLLFPMWIAYLSVPVGSCLMLLSFLRRLYLLCFRPDAALPSRTGDRSQ